MDTHADFVRIHKDGAGTELTDPDTPAVISSDCDTEVRSPQATLDGDLDNGDIEIAKGGYYLVGYNVTVLSDGVGTITASARIGSTIIPGTETSCVGVATEVHPLSATTLVYLEANQSIYLYLGSSAGDDITPQDITFWAMRIG